VLAGFYKQFSKQGYKDISFGKSTELRDHGVSPDFINEFAALGYKDISLNQAQNLRDHGVSPDFVNGFRQNRI